MIRYLLLSGFILGMTQSIFSQDSAYAAGIIAKLSSPAFEGRGYVKKGDKKAAHFIIDELKKQGLAPLCKNYQQPFAFPINTMDGAMEVSLDGKKLLPVRQFVPIPDCPPVKGVFPLVYLPAEADTNNALYNSLLKVDFGNVFVVTAFSKRKTTRVNPFKSLGMVVPVKNIMWWAAGANSIGLKPIVNVVDSLLISRPTTIYLNIESHLKKKHPAQNLAAYIPGAVQPDTFIVFSAHYDHLGYMGRDSYFPGANDNASGTSLVLSLAKQLQAMPQKPYYSIAFLFFAGEEVGLLGSAYYVSNPLFPLENIKALINLDMVGSGSEGISMVNGKKNPQLASVMDSINRENHYLPDIRIGDESCNSDQCYFAQKGVPAIFIFTRGKECPYYHVFDDNAAHTPLTKFNALEKLLLQTTESLNPK